MPKETFLNLPEEKQEKIMRSAVSEFLKHGFEKGNVGDIAKNAQVAKGSMYQYFQDKKELFLYSVQWSLAFLMKKYAKYISYENKQGDVFDFIYENSKQIWIQMREEMEICIFIQNVFLGKYMGLTDESMTYMIKMSEEYLKKIIRAGKETGSIRSDIDDDLLSLFILGASYKFKEHMMNKARSAGEDIMNEDFEVHEKEIKIMLDLIKNGIGAGKEYKGHNN